MKTLTFTVRLTFDKHLDGLETEIAQHLASAIVFQVNHEDTLAPYDQNAKTEQVDVIYDSSKYSKEAINVTSVRHPLTGRMNLEI